MKIVQILFFSFFLFNSNLNACCGPEFYSFSELLIEQDDRRGIFVCQIDSLYLNERQWLTASATIMEGFKGKQKKEKVLLTAIGYGERNMDKMKQGEKYLIIGYAYDQKEYGARECYLYYKPFDKSKDEISLFRKFFRKINSNYTGKYTVKYGKEILATGQMKKGKLDGQWKHYSKDYRNKDMTNVSLEVNYKSGIYDGTYKRYSGNQILNESRIYENGELIQQESYSGRKGERFLYRRMTKENGVEKIIIYKPDGRIDRITTNPKTQKHHT